MRRELLMQLLADEKVVCTLAGEADVSRKGPLCHDTMVQWKNITDKTGGGAPIRAGDRKTVGDAEESLLDLGAALYAGTGTEYMICYGTMRKISETKLKNGK